MLLHRILMTILLILLLLGLMATVSNASSFTYECRVVADGEINVTTDFRTDTSYVRTVFEHIGYMDYAVSYRVAQEELNWWGLF